jgi:hypothetical protein
VALDIGELVGRLRVDPKPMDKGLEQGESKFQKFGDNLATLAAGLGGMAAMALIGGLLAGMDKEAVGAKIAAQMGGSDEDARMYGETAGALYAEGWGDSIATIGETLKTVASANILQDGTPEELAETARQAQILADVFGQDVNGSVRAVQQMIRNGLVPDAKTGFDLIAAGVQGGLDKSEDLLDTINEYSTQFRELGLDAEQAFGLMSQAVKAGARDTDTAADALKEFAIRSKDGSTTSAEGFKAIGLNGQKMTKIFAKGGPEAATALGTVLDKLKAMKDPVAQDAAAVALFGTKAEDLGDALFAMDLETARQGFEDTAGAIDKAGKSVQETDAAKLERFKREATELASKIAADMVPALESMVKWIKENESWITPLVATLGGLAAAIVVVNLATKAWAATEAAFIAVKGAATAMQWLFNAALWASPITWIVLGLLLLIGIIVLIATKTDWFQRLWNWAWGGIKAGAAAVWSWMRDTLWPWLKSFYTNFVASMVQAKDKYLQAWNTIKDFLGKTRDFFRDVFNKIGDFITAGFNRGRDGARSAVNGIIGFANGAIGGLNRIIEGANKIPGINIGTIGSIPKLARGGAVSPSPGGTPVIMGDGGEVEYGVPKSDMRSIIGDAVRASGGGGHAEVRVIVATERGEVLRVIRSEVSAQGGNVQTVLGPRR